MPTTKISARTGTYVQLKLGQKLKLINTHGNQVIDFWAFSFAESSSQLSIVPTSMLRSERNTSSSSHVIYPFASGIQYFSASRTRSILSRLIPNALKNDKLYSNKSKAMFTFLEDTTTGVHDTLYGCCDRFRYEQLGVGDYEHASCSENMHLALAEAAKAGVLPEHVSMSMSVILKRFAVRSWELQAIC
jgi:uncharacterized protein YcgI (DUF1989 family)